MPSNEETQPMVDAKGRPLKYPKKTKVTRAIICNSIKDIEDRHPLRSTVGWDKVSCCCRFCCCCAKKKKPFKAALKECIQEELGLDPIIENKNEPYLVLGYGANAYFDILHSLAKMFFWLFIFAIPLYMIYNREKFFLG